MEVHIRSVSLSILFVVGFFAVPARAQERDSVEMELRSVRSKMEEEQGKLAALRKDEAALKKTIDRLNSDESKLATERDKVAGEVRQFEEDSLVVELAARETEKRLAAERIAMTTRVVSLYKMKRRSTTLGYLLQAMSALDLLKRIRYLASVVAFDSMLINEFEGTMKTLSIERRKLDDLRKKREAALKKNAALLGEIDRKQIERAVALRGVEEKRKLQELSIAKLTRTTTRLEKVLQSVMGSEERPVPLETADTPKRSFEGVGLASLKGKLPLPVAGKIVQHFGKQRHDEVSAQLVSKGVEFGAGAGEKVRPVAPGKVVMVQNLPGFGNVVILDHGARYYTLYGRLDSPSVKVGDVVDRGSTLGVLGEIDYRGRNFYFELRYRGQAVDPVGYF